MIQTPSRTSFCGFVDQGYFWSLAIFALTIPVRPFFLQNILSYSTILFLLFALAKVLVCRDFNLRERYNQVLLFAAPFIWWGIGLLYSEDLNRAFKMLETKLVLILIPGFVLLINPISKDKFKKLLSLYAIGVTAYLLLSYILVINQNYQYNEFRKVIIPFYLYHSLVHFIGMHATYMSIQVALACLIVFDELLQKSKRTKIVILVFWLAFLLFALISLTTKMVILGFTIALIGYLLSRVGIVRSLKFVIPVFILMIVSGIYLSQNDWFQKRFLIKEKSLIQDFSLDPENKKGNWGSLNMRYALAICSWDIISENFLFGTGIGDAKTERHKAYKERNYYFALNKGFNEHNQYLNLWLSSGIIGLLIFAAVLFVPLRYAALHNDPLLLGYIILVAIAFLSENYLSRQIGVAFFAFFLSLFWHNRSLTQ